jgi:tetratricopeptide (TPR) repeat protein
MRVLVLSALLFTALLTLACSGGGANSNVPSGDSPAFAEITDANQALAVGNDLLENNETERAIEAFLRATELDPDLAEAWFKLGIAYSLIEKEQQLAAQEDVNAVESQQKPGRTNSEKAFRRAIEAYKKMLAQNPDDDVALFNLGRAYNKLNEDEEAARSLKQAVRVKPDDSEYQTELGAILIKLARYHEAIPPLKKALELDPDNSRAASLLEDAEAGRTRVEYVPPKKDTNANANANVNANVNSNVSVKPTPAEKPTPKQDTAQNPTPKPKRTPDR